MSAGRVVVVGLGPGAEGLVTPDVAHALAEATDIVGYGPYVARVPTRAGLTLHASDNRVEVERATFAIDLAAVGKNVVIVSSGDPGVFGMASALFEALERRGDAHHLDIHVLPGVSAMFAAAARIGAPLGHDFCAINLSDNLKPWPLVEKRLRLAIEADFAIALYNPRSKARPHQCEQAFAVMRAASSVDRIVMFAKAISTPQETIATAPLSQARGELADMRTLVLIGNSTTRRVGRFIYTPRFAS